MKKELKDVLDEASKRVKSRPDYLLSPEVRSELEKLEEERKRKSQKDAIYCEHANEVSANCSCSLDCYCKTRTCKNK